MTAVKQVFPGNGHYELTRSNRANEYVWKDDTAVPDTRFEFGSLPVKRNCATDWELVRSNAQAGRLDDIPADIYVRYFNQLNNIQSHFSQPLPLVRTATVFWGPTGTGKSRRAWDEATFSAYSKDPRTKFWCGYRGQENVVIDEFRGGIDIAHLLRWLDRYPVRVEVKGSTKPLMATSFWITSNIHPDGWYPMLDRETYAALERRLNIIHIT